MSNAERKILESKRTGNRRERIVRHAGTQLQNLLILALSQEKIGLALDHFEPFFVAHRKLFRFFQKLLPDAEVAFLADGELGFDTPQTDPLRIYLEGAVDRLIGSIEIPQHLIIESEILQRPGVFRIQTGCLLKICGGLGPFSLPALDSSNSQINFGLVRQCSLCNFELLERSFVIVVAPIVREPKCK